MFDYIHSKDYTTDKEKNQDTYDKKLHLLKATETGYKLLCGVGSLQKNQRQFAIVYLQTPQRKLYPQERVQMSKLKTRKGVLDFIYDLPDEFSRLEDEELEEIQQKIIQLLQNTKDKPVFLGEDESPQGVYVKVVEGINFYSESIENNPLALVFTKDNVGYIRTTFFDEFSKKLKTGYTRKEILGLLKLSGKLITDKNRPYDKRLHFGAVNGKYYAVRLPENIGKETEEKIEITIPPLDEKILKKMQTEKIHNNSKITFYGYYGGKNRICDMLNNLMPQSKIFIEPFIGSGSTIMNRDRSEIEIVNDFDPAIANMYMMLADKDM